MCFTEKLKHMFRYVFILIRAESQKKLKMMVLKIKCRVNRETK